MSDIRCLEHPTLKVPYENLNKRFRASQKIIEREVAQVNASISEIEKALLDNSRNQTDFHRLLEQLQTKLETLRKKNTESVQAEIAVADSIQRRINHLRVGCAPNNPVAMTVWKKTRLDRMLVEHFLRSGFYESATKLAEIANVSDLTNINLFMVAKDVEDSLSKKDTSKCLAWCYDNKSKLRKLKSNLEFNVRLQEFIELVKQGKKLEAVQHARKHLSAVDAEQFPVVQQGMALLAFPSDTPIKPYSEFFQDGRWQDLVEQFRNENYRLYQLSSQSVFSVALQAGLSCLKTQKCSSKTMSDRNSECPVCQPLLNELAAHLPYAHCSQSRLICFLSGKPLNEHNHPMMLPNGYVYGENALLKMSLENDGQIVCPRTKDIYSFTDAEKIYVM